MNFNNSNLVWKKLVKYLAINFDIKTQLNVFRFYQCFTEVIEIIWFILKKNCRLDLLRETK